MPILKKALSDTVLITTRNKLFQQDLIQVFANIIDGARQYRGKFRFELRVFKKGLS